MDMNSLDCQFMMSNPTIEVEHSHAVAIIWGSNVEPQCTTIIELVVLLQGLLALGLARHPNFEQFRCMDRNLGRIAPYEHHCRYPTPTFTHHS